MAGLTVVVTGATGFIGRHLVRRLADRKELVRAVDTRAPDPSSPLPENVELHLVDVRDTEQLRPVLAGVDTVYHLASAHLEVNVPDTLYEAVNVEAVERLVNAAAAAEVRRFVHTSSVGIYGHVAAPPAAEDAPKHPGTVYERTKLVGEECAVRTARAAGLSLIVVRPAWVYGPGCPRTQKLVRALRKGVFFYVGNGSNLRHPVYVDDAVDGMLAAAAAPDACSGRAYIIAGPRPVTLREYVEEAAQVLGVRAPKLVIPRMVGRGLALGTELAFRVLGRQPPFSRRSLGLFENDSAFDTAAARRDLSFEAQTDLQTGLQRTMGDMVPQERHVP